MTAAIPCPRCQADTADGLLCHDCTRKLRKDLRGIADLWPELQVTLTRQGRSGVSGRRTDPSPLPYHVQAVKVADYTRNQLQAKVSDLEMGDAGDLPDDPIAWCQWLADRAERIRGHQEADEIVAEFAYCRSLMWRVIDTQEDRVYAGPCPICCRDLYADRGETHALCRLCEVVAVPVSAARSEMWQQAEAEALVPRRLIVGVLEVWGMPVKPSTWRQWIARGHLVPVWESNGAPLYPVARVLELARRVRDTPP